MIRNTSPKFPWGLRIMGLIPWVALFSSDLAHADYAQDLDRIKRRSETINRELKKLGYGTPSAPANGTAEEKGPTRLFVVHDSVQRLQITTGTVLEATTETRLVVGTELAPAVVVLAENQGSLSGLRVLGRARAASIQGRVQIEFDRAVLRSGKVQPIKALALDIAGASGLEAEVFSGKALAIAGALGSSFISGLAASQQSVTTSAFGLNQVQPGGRNAILQGVAQAAADQSKRFVDEATQEKPVLVVEPATSLNVYFDEEVRF